MSSERHRRKRSGKNAESSAGGPSSSLGAGPVDSDSEDVPPPTPPTPKPGAKSSASSIADAAVGSSRSGGRSSTSGSRISRRPAAVVAATAPTGDAAAASEKESASSSTGRSSGSRISRKTSASIARAHSGSAAGSAAGSPVAPAVADASASSGSSSPAVPLLNIDGTTSNSGRRRRKRHSSTDVSESGGAATLASAGLDDDSSDGAEFASLLELSDDDAKILRLQEQIKDIQEAKQKNASATAELNPNHSPPTSPGGSGSTGGRRHSRRHRTKTDDGNAGAAAPPPIPSDDEESDAVAPSLPSDAPPPVTRTRSRSDDDDDDDPQQQRSRHARRRRRKHKTEQELADDLVEQQILAELNTAFRVDGGDGANDPGSVDHNDSDNEHSGDGEVGLPRPNSASAVGARNSRTDNGGDGKTAPAPSSSAFTTPSGAFSMNSRRGARTASNMAVRGSPVPSGASDSPIASPVLNRRGSSESFGGLGDGAGLSRSMSATGAGRRSRAATGDSGLGAAGSPLADAPAVIANGSAPGSPALGKVRLSSRGSRRSRGTSDAAGAGGVLLDATGSPRSPNPLRTLSDLGGAKDAAGRRASAQPASPVRVRRQFAASDAVTSVWTTDDAHDLANLRRVLNQRAGRISLADTLSWVRDNEAVGRQAGSAANVDVRFTPSMSVASVLRLLADRAVFFGGLWEQERYLSTLAVPDFVDFLLSVFHGPKENYGYVRFGLEQVRAVMDYAKPAHQPRLHRPSDSLTVLVEDLRHAGTALAVLDETSDGGVRSILTQQHLLRFLLDASEVVSATSNQPPSQQGVEVTVRTRPLLRKCPVSKLPVFSETDLVKLSHKRSVADAFRVMLAFGLPAVAVVDEEGRLVGNVGLGALQFVTAETFDKLGSQPMTQFFAAHSEAARRYYGTTPTCTGDDVLAEILPQLMSQSNQLGGLVWVLSSAAERRPVAAFTIFRLLQYFMTSTSKQLLSDVPKTRTLDDASIPSSSLYASGGPGGGVTSLGAHLHAALVQDDGDGAAGGVGSGSSPGGAGGAGSGGVSPQLTTLRKQRGLARSGSFIRASSFVRSRLSQAAGRGHAGSGSSSGGAAGGAGAGGAGGGGASAGSDDNRRPVGPLDVGAPGDDMRQESRWTAVDLPLPSADRLSMLRCPSVLWLLLREQPDSAVPSILDECCNSLLSRIGEVDVYRSPGSREEVLPLLQFFDRRLNSSTLPRDEPLPSSMAAPRAVATLLLMFLHTLRVPLIPFSLYDCFARFAWEQPSRRLLSRVRMLLLSCPVAHHPSLARLLCYLHKAAAHPGNGTTVAQLASAFGPELIRPRAETISTVRNTLQLNTLVEMMIMHGPQLALGLTSAEPLRRMLPALRRTLVRKDEKTAKSGYLMKKSTGTGPLGGKWQKRYFCLKTNALIYFKDPGDETPANTYPLRGPLVACLPRNEFAPGDSKAGDQYDTHFVLTDGDGRTTFLQTVTPNAEDAEEWTEAIQQAIQKCNSQAIEEAATPMPCSLFTASQK